MIAGIVVSTRRMTTPPTLVSVPFSGGGFQEDSGDVIFGNFRGEMMDVITQFGTNFTNVGGVNYYPVILDYETFAMVYVIATDQFEHLQTGIMSEALPSLMEGVDQFKLVTPEGEMLVDEVVKMQLGTSYVWMKTTDVEVYNNIITNPEAYSMVQVK